MHPDGKLLVKLVNTFMILPMIGDSWNRTGHIKALYCGHWTYGTCKWASFPELLNLFWAFQHREWAQSLHWVTRYLSSCLESCYYLTNNIFDAFSHSNVSARGRLASMYLKAWWTACPRINLAKCLSERCCRKCTSTKSNEILFQANVWHISE